MGKELVIGDDDVFITEQTVINEWLDSIWN
jgi:hypothetical protein